jgi:hypothetical protein
MKSLEGPYSSLGEVPQGVSSLPVKKSKPYELSLTEKAGYAHAVVTGPNSVDNMNRYLEELLRECMARGYRRLLIEERFLGPRIGMTDVFQLASTTSDRARGFFEAVAYVDVNAENDRNVKFAEDVVVNRGLQARMFRTVAEAEEWLKS